MLVMPFGRHAGKPLVEVPDNYLRWCLRKLRDMDPTLRRAMNAELRRRGREAEHAACERVARYRRDRQRPAVASLAEAEQLLAQALCDGERLGHFLPSRALDEAWRALAMLGAAVEAGGSGATAGQVARAEDPGGPRLLVELARRASAN